LKIYAPRISGLILCVIGVVWFFQGVGAISGSFMSGRPLWAGIGSACFVGGIVLLALGSAAARRNRSEPEEP
jgi:hypothetical protein